MPICLPQQCLALVYGLPPPGDPLFRESPGWWVRLQSVGHRHRTCSHVFVPENFENFRKLFYVYMSTPAMPGPCVWAPTPWRSLCATHVAYCIAFLSARFSTWKRSAPRHTRCAECTRFGLHMDTSWVGGLSCYPTIGEYRNHRYPGPHTPCTMPTHHCRPPGPAHCWEASEGMQQGPWAGWVVVWGQRCVLLSQNPYAWRHIRQILYQCIYNGFNLRPPNCQKIGKLQLPRWGLLKNALLRTLFTLQWGFKKICHCLQQ